MWQAVREFIRRPGGFSEVFSLALPMVISTASTTLMQFTDRLFLVVYSETAMAAALPAGALQFAITSLFWGTAMYCNTFVAQYQGANRPRKIGAASWQGIWLAIFSAPLLLGLIPFGETIFQFAGHGAEISRLEAIYFRVALWGSPAIIMSAAISAFFSGRGLTQVVMWVNVAAALINVVLDYLMIFGKGGFPEWGIAGAAWATVISQWFAVVIWFVLFLSPKNRREFNTLPWPLFRADMFGRLLRFGFPQGLQFAVEIGAFSAFMFVVGRLGDRALAATGLALNVNSLAFMPVFGIGIAAETLMGQRLGENRPDLAARSTWSAFFLALSYTGVLGSLYLFGGDWLLYLHEVYTPNPSQFAQLKELTIILLRFVAIYCLLDTTQMIFSCVIKGAGDTHFVLVNTLITSPLPVAAAYIGVNTFGLGLYWCWSVLTGWVCLLGVIYLLRFLTGRWKTMRVIEHAPVA